MRTDEQEKDLALLQSHRETARKKLDVAGLIGNGAEVKYIAACQAVSEFRISTGDLGYMS